jgi:hypothetical protein
MSTRKLLTSCFALLGAGCTAGPEPPYYHGPAIVLGIHVADPPPNPGPHVQVSLDFVPYCAPYDALSPDGRGAGSEGFGAVPFEPSAARMNVTVTSSYSRYQGPCQGAARFFRPSVHFDFEGNGVAGLRPGTWLTNAFVVHAPVALAFAPFGPDGPHVSVPVGTSIVRRTCGMPGSSGALELASSDSVLEFQRRPIDLPMDGSAQLEEDERRFLTGCGITPPPPSMGTRIGLDTPGALVWSGDQTRLYYLVPPLTDTGPLWQRPPVSLRSLPSGGGAPIELVAGISGRLLVAPSSGEVFVQDLDSGIERGQPQADGSVVLTRLAIPVAQTNSPMFSPDGKWIALVGGAAPFQTTIWDVAASAARTGAPGTAVGWAPDSRRLAFRGPAEGLRTPFFVEDVQTGVSSPVGSGDGFLWSSQGAPAIVHSPMAAGSSLTIDILDSGAATRTVQLFSAGGAIAWADGRPIRIFGAPWAILQTLDGNKWNSFPGSNAGLAIEDPLAGAPRTIVPTSETAPQSYAAYPELLSNDGTVLTWTRRCFGLYGTVCVFQLHQITLPGGADRVVAVSNDPPVSALSPDRRRIAIGTSRGIFVKELP